MAAVRIIGQFCEQKNQRGKDITNPTFDLEREISDNFYLSPVIDHNNPLIIAGCDEAGRGPLCGPVVAAAVIFKTHDIDWQKFKINDSKKMTAAARDATYEFLTNHPDIIWATASCSPAEIDELNILAASMLAMERAIDALSVRPDFVLIDGNRLPDCVVPPLLRGAVAGTATGGRSPSPPLAGLPLKKGEKKPIPGRAVVGGDSNSISIAAASIIAKVTRDRIMQKLVDEFPEYGWDKNAGYPTAAHLQAIEKHGINKHYRMTYKPVMKIMGDKNEHSYNI